MFILGDRTLETRRLTPNACSKLDRANCLTPHSKSKKLTRMARNLTEVERLGYNEAVQITVLNETSFLVSRITAESETVDVEITLDVNTEIYPLEAGEKFSFALASTLSLDGSVADAQTKDAWRDRPGERTLADDYDYVMYGKVYKYDDSGASKV